MKNTDLRAKARAIFGSAIAEPMPKQPNGAKALQQRANARPIPTYKVGGPVKKPMPTPGESVKSGNRMSKQEGDEMRFMEMLEKKKRPMPTPAESVKSGNRMAREEGAEMKKMKMAVGGKAPAPPNASGNKFIKTMPMPEKGYPPKAAPTPPNASGNKFIKTMPMPEKGYPQTGGKAPTPPKVTPPDTNPKINLRPGPRVAKGSFVDPFRRELGDARTPPKVTPPEMPPGMKKGGKVQTSSDTARKLATEMGGYKKGGKVKDIEVDMKGLGEMSRSMSSLPKADLESRAAEARSMNTARAKETSDATKKQSFKEAFNEARKEQGPNGVFTWRGNTYNTKMAGESPKAGRAAAPAPTRATAAAASTPLSPATRGMSDAEIRSFSKGLNADADSSLAAAKPARAAAPVKPRVGLRNTEYGSYLADILDKEDAANAASNKKLVERYKSEGRPRLAKIVSMLSGAEYAKGGKVKAEKTKEAKPKNGLAVMIAIGSPKKPAKKMSGGAPDGYAAGGAGKMRKGMMPEKFAQGGAGKVRKGMMSPEGNIINAMNKMRGK